MFSTASVSLCSSQGFDVLGWLDHFETVCREAGHEVSRTTDGTVHVKASKAEGLDLPTLCDETSRRANKGTVAGAAGGEPLTREEYDKEVDRKEDLRDLDASKRAHREYLKTMATEALRLAKAELHVPFMLAWASVIVSIEKDLI